MPIRAITFDFHNTLACCDDWFELEVRDLVPAVLTWHGQNTGTVVDSTTLERAVASYRALRLEIIHHGDEVDALDCTMHVINDLGMSIDRATVDEGIHSVMRATLANSTPVPGVIEAVNALAELDIRLGVVSSAVFHPFLEWSLEQFGIVDQFATIVSSASCGYYKSRTEIYATALDTLGVVPEETVHVGDSYRFDVQTARRLGIGTVWYRPDPATEPMGCNEANLTVRSLEGIADAILNEFASVR
jgi:HAD superfamily hydrolase (TIGR01549 family)